MATGRLGTIFSHLLNRRRHSITINQASLQSCSQLLHSLANSPCISAEPRVGLYDDKVKISLSGFPNNKKVTLLGQFVQKGKGEVIFASCGHYVTDRNGALHVWEQESTGGTYTGVEPMGIVWSLQAAPGQPHHTRMAINFTDRPSIIQLKAFQGHLELEEIYDESSPTPVSLANLELERWFTAPGVTRTEVHAGNVRGALYLPPGEGPFQGVIDMFGSAGGIIEYRAALLASRGFATLSLPYFRYKDLVPNLIEVTFDYFEEAVKWFSSHPKVFPGGIGVVAVSKGVEYAIAMGGHLDKVSCVVGINGFPFIGLSDLYHQKKLLYKASEYEMSALKITDEGVIFRECNKIDNNLIQGWLKDTKYLFFLSEDDYQINTSAYDLLTAACPENKRGNFEEVRYPGAGHLLEPPYTALCRSAINPTFQMLFLFGGERKQHAHAQEDSWQRILNHLRQNIPTTL